MGDSLHLADHDRTLVPGVRAHVAVGLLRWSGVIATYESGRQVGYYESGAIFTDESQAWAWTEQQLAAAELAAQQKEQDDEYHAYQRAAEAPTVYSDPTQKEES